MYKYKCNAVGDCSVANRGEPITSETMLNDPKCSDCQRTLILLEDGISGVNGVNGVNGGDNRISRKTWLVAAAVLVAVVLGGGTWYALRPSDNEEPVAKTPTPVVAASAAAEPRRSPAAPTVKTAGGGITPSDSETSNARREADKKLSSGEFSEAEKKAARAAALEMIKTAVAKMGQGDLTGAEKELMQARERDATESLIYYNLAIVRLRQQQPEEALKQLEAAFMAGFTHFDAMDKDTDLDALRNQPNFKKLMAIYRKRA